MLQSITLQWIRSKKFIFKQLEDCFSPSGEKVPEFGPRSDLIMRSFVVHSDWPLSYMASNRSNVRAFEFSDLSGPLELWSLVEGPEDHRAIRLGLLIYNSLL